MNKIEDLEHDISSLRSKERHLRAAFDNEYFQRSSSEQQLVWMEKSRVRNYMAEMDRQDERREREVYGMFNRDDDREKKRLAEKERQEEAEETLLRLSESVNASKLNQYRVAANQLASSKESELQILFQDELNVRARQSSKIMREEENRNVEEERRDKWLAEHKVRMEELAAFKASEMHRRQRAEEELEMLETELNQFYNC